MRSHRLLLFLSLLSLFKLSEMMPEVRAEERKLVVRTYVPATETIPSQRANLHQTWNPAETAVIVCDVWDAHHSVNAVRRMSEFLPRLNKLLTVARESGATIIHSPSDCMPSYEDHPARKSAQQALIEYTKSGTLPPDINAWVNLTKAEREAFRNGLGRYPLDQSDGGEDDDPMAHSEWAGKLRQEGRNPSLPWKKQSSVIEIKDGDFLSDRGEEVWSVLQNKKIKLVVLVGVHTNMCVLGRPFGLRQMVNNGMRTVLVRDLTDCMYNPKRWPFVDHFSGNDLLIAHVERFVCPTITSNQIINDGRDFYFATDKRLPQDRELDELPAKAISPKRNAASDWTVKAVPATEPLLPPLPEGKVDDRAIWYRCTLRLMTRHLGDKPELKLVLRGPMLGSKVWLNGQDLGEPILNDEGLPSVTIPSSLPTWDDANLLVIRLSTKATKLDKAPLLSNGTTPATELAGLWQARVGGAGLLSNIPLPAKFGTTPEIVFEPGSER